MKVTFSGMGVTYMRGKMGGTLMTKNRFGACAGNYRNHSNPRTVGQQNQRAKFGQVVSYWATQLDESERAAWDSEALNPQWEQTPPFGDPYQPSGFQLFTICNLGGYSDVFPLVTPPNYPTWDIPVITDFIAAYTGSVFNIVVTFDRLSASDQAVEIWATWGLSQGLFLCHNSLFRKITTTPITDPAFELRFRSSYLVTFPAPPVNTEVFLQVYTYDTLSGAKLFTQKSSAIVSSE